VADDKDGKEQDRPHERKAASSSAREPQETEDAAEDEQRESKSAVQECKQPQPNPGVIQLVDSEQNVQEEQPQVQQPPPDAQPQLPNAEEKETARREQHDASALEQQQRAPAQKHKRLISGE
jgi:hypothetical protein